jgi:hypothetical protein
MIPVKSKGIRGIAYDPDARTLDIEFSSSKIYRYFDVPPSLYEWLTRVESKGRFVNRLIKDKYRYERIDGPSASDTDLLDSLRKSLDDRSRDD